MIGLCKKYAVTLILINCFSLFKLSLINVKFSKISNKIIILHCFRMWWTITGNFGNILPIDWSKSYARKAQLPVLNLNNNPQVKY